MTFLFVATGQCGNQLCLDLLNELSYHCLPPVSLTSPSNFNFSYLEERARQKLTDSLFQEASPSIFSTYDPLNQSNLPLKARAICVDTEPKVVENCLELAEYNSSEIIHHNKNEQDIFSRNYSKGRSTTNSNTGTDRVKLSWNYNKKRTVTGHGGAGNNWSTGYSIGHSASSGDFCRTSSNLPIGEATLESIRLELEASSTLPHIYLLQSAAGGTGSGLGSAISEEIADHFPQCNLSNIVVTPLHCGEVVVQYYNTLLSLSHLSQSSDSITLMENETAHSLCRDMHGISNPKLVDYNRVISQNLLSLFVPRHLGTKKSNNSIPSFVSNQELLQHLVPLPGYKFLQVRLTPQTSKESIIFTHDSWHSLLRTLQRLQLSGSMIERRIRTDLKSLGLREVYAEVKDSVVHTNNEKLQSNSKEFNIKNEENNSINRSLASIITLHGNESRDFIKNIKNDLLKSSSSNINNLSNINSKYLQNKQKILNNNDNTTPETFFPSYFTSHTKLHYNLKKSKYKKIIDYNDNDINNDNINPYYKELQAISFYSSSIPLNGYFRTATTISNDQSVFPLLRRVCEESEKLFRKGAFVHQYSLGREDWEESFQNLGGVALNYYNL